MRNYYLLIIFLLFGCNSKIFNPKAKRAEKERLQCTYCNIFMYKKDYLPIERNVTVFGLHYIEFVTQSNRIIGQREFEYIMPWKPGPMSLFSAKEWEALNDSRFCFLGKTKKELRKLFKDNEDEVSTKNGIHFYYFNGKNLKPIDGNPNDFRVDKMQYLQFINFDADSVFVGTARDSLQIKYCIETGNKK